MLNYRKSTDEAIEAWFAYKKVKLATGSVVDFIAGWNAARGTEVKVHEALSAASGVALTEQNYEDWLHGGDTYDVFDDVAKQWLGKDAYTEMEIKARLDAYLQYKLGIGPKEAGGIVFK